MGFWGCRDDRITFGDPFGGVIQPQNPIKLSLAVSFFNPDFHASAQSGIKKSHIFRWAFGVVGMTGLPPVIHLGV